MLALLPSTLEKMSFRPKRILIMRPATLMVLQLPKELWEVRIIFGVSQMEYFTLLSLTGKKMMMRNTTEKDGKKAMKSQRLNCQKVSLSPMHSLGAQILCSHKGSQHALIFSTIATHQETINVLSDDLLKKIDLRKLGLWSML